MDRFIAKFHAVDDGDLVLCPERGAAFQKDRTHLVNYDAAYYDKCASYENQRIANEINRGRIDLVHEHYGDGVAVDIGIGSGEFIKNRGSTFGFDVNPVAIEWLKRNNLFAHYLSDFECFTFWDVIEHVEEPERYFRSVGIGSYLFTSLPIFTDLRKIRESKHYRPGEHLYYWTHEGFIEWMALHGFRHLETRDFETKAGRESINSYAFDRVK